MVKNYYEKKLIMTGLKYAKELGVEKQVRFLRKHIIQEVSATFNTIKSNLLKRKLLIEKEGVSEGEVILGFHEMMKDLGEICFLSTKGHDEDLEIMPTNIKKNAKK